MEYNAYRWLTTCSAGDCNYKTALKRATNNELRQAIIFMHGKPGNKGRITACERELRKRKRGSYTLNEWAAMDGITILDPDGFDRTDPQLMERKFTREEYEKGIYLCTVIGKVDGH